VSTATEVLRSSATKQEPSLLKGGLHLALRRRTTPKGNSQCERADQTVWRTVKLLLLHKNLAENWWEVVLPEALHAVRSLVCLATNQWNASWTFVYVFQKCDDWDVTSFVVSHHRTCSAVMFCSKERWSSHRWSSTRRSKPFLDCNALFWLKESSISTSDLALHPESPVGLVDTCRDFDDVRCNQPELSPDTMDSHSVGDGSFDTAPADNPATYPRNVPLHRSAWIHKPPDR